MASTLYTRRLTRRCVCRNQRSDKKSVKRARGREAKADEARVKMDGRAFCHYFCNFTFCSAVPIVVFFPLRYCADRPSSIVPRSSSIPRYLIYKLCVYEKALLYERAVSQTSSLLQSPLTTISHSNPNDLILLTSYLANSYGTSRCGVLSSGCPIAYTFQNMQNRTATYIHP